MLIKKDLDTTMKRKIAIILYILSLLICFDSCNRDKNTPAELLKQKINNAEMKEYVDSVYGAKLLYPDFFEVDTTDEYNKVRYCYSDDKVKELSLSLHYFPPRLFENVDKIVDSFEYDSLYACIEKKNNSCIMKGKDGPNSEYIYLIKYYRSRHGWAACTLIYEPQYEDAVERLVKMVKGWKIYSEDNPEWLTDTFDFLDI